jgi:hypothetical protein
MSFRTRKTPLVYSEVFRNAVRDVYKNNKIIEDLLDKNDYFLGRCLNDGTYSTISYETVIELLEAGEADKLLELAYHIKRIVDLYQMWDKEVFLD